MTFIARSIAAFAIREHGNSLLPIATASDQSHSRVLCLVLVIFPCVQEVALTQPTLSRPDRQDVHLLQSFVFLHFGTTNAPLETGSVFACVWGSPSGLRARAVGRW